MTSLPRTASQADARPAVAAAEVQTGTPTGRQRQGTVSASPKLCPQVRWTGEADKKKTIHSCPVGWSPRIQ